MEKLQFYLNSFGDRYLYEANRGTFNQLGASAVFARHFGERLFPNDTLVIIVGTDSGLLPRHIQRHGVPDGTRYLFLELDALLPTVIDELAGDELDEVLHMTGQHGLRDALKAVRFQDYANIGAIRLLESIAAVDAYLPDYSQATAQIRQELDAVLWAHNCQLSNPTFVRCQLQNLIEEQVPAEVLRDSFAGHTALLLGGGPSLDDILPWAREHQDQVVIFAVSRICRRLLEADVHPHIVVSIDPTELSFDISKELLLLDERTVFAHANHVFHGLLAQWRGRSVYMDRRYPWPSRLDGPNIRAAGPTVTNTAFALACAMGFSRVIFGGIDLCHSQDGYSHARGSNERDAGPRLGGTGMKIETNAEGRAETTPDFFNAVTAFGAQALAARHSGVEIVNPAPRAAVIEGVDYRPLPEIVLDRPESNPFDVLHGRLPPDSRAFRVENLSVMKRELARANGRLRKIVTLAEEALDCNDGLFGRNGKTADFRHKKRMDKIERQLDTRLKDLSEVVRMFSSRAFLHMPPSDRDWTDEEIEQAGRTYYTAYRENAREVLALIEQAQERIETALAETDEAPDFERLFAQWERDGVPGRSLVWLHRRLQEPVSLPATVAARFDRFADNFDRLMQQRDTSHARKVRGETSLAPVRGRLQLLFKEGSERELERLVHQLEGMDGGEALQLSYLARGYLAELRDTAETAFGIYAQLIDVVRENLAEEGEQQPQPELEDALRRMVFIAMSNEWRDQALLILETLAGLAPAYEPQFAELLRLSGHPEAAADVYTDYLTKAPGDHVTMLRLGKLYQTMGVREAARSAFRYVLEKDPDNSAAQALLRQLETAA